jgi:hypothetical protein
MALDRSAITLPDLPREDVALPELGGDVTVRGLLLRDRMALFAGLRDDADNFASMARLLHLSVVGSDDRPLLTEAEWERFGGAHIDAALRAFTVAKRLAGLDPEEAAKN